MFKFKRTLLLFTISLAVLTSACSYTPLREHPTLEDQLSKIDRIVVAPPEVTIELVKFAGNNERLTEKEATITSQLQSVAQQGIEAHDFTLVDFDFNAVALNDDTFAFDLEQVRASYLEADQVLYTTALSKDKVRTVSASVGSIINTVGSKTEADAVLMLTYAGVKKSGGKMAQEYISSVLLSILTGYYVIPVSEGAAIKVALLDAVTGDVLWANKAVEQSIGTANFKKLMKKFPHNLYTAPSKQMADSRKQNVLNAEPNDSSLAM